jgi:6-pyruvoyl-tetrahydropterin synthase
MRSQLILHFEFIASHSLSVRETPHDHRWRLKTVIQGEPQNGMILNMVEVRSAFQTCIAPLAQTYLNDNDRLSPAAQQTPTCESLAAHFFDQFTAVLTDRFCPGNPTVRLQAIEVELYEPDGQEWGSVRLEQS